MGGLTTRVWKEKFHELTIWCIDVISQPAWKHNWQLHKSKSWGQAISLPSYTGQPCPELIQLLPLAAHVDSVNSVNILRAIPHRAWQEGDVHSSEQLVASVLIYASSWFAQLCDLLVEMWGSLHHLPICQGHSAPENYLPPAGLHRRSLSWVIVLGGSNDIIKGWQSAFTLPCYSGHDFSLLLPVLLHALTIYQSLKVYISNILKPL